MSETAAAVPVVPGASALFNSAGGATAGTAAAAAMPAPKFLPSGVPLPSAAFDAPEAVQARAMIKEKIEDKEFYKSMIAERERGEFGPACQLWGELHRKGHPSGPAIASQADVDDQASNRNNEMMNAHIANLKTKFSMTPEQEAEIRGGVVDERAYRWAQEEKQLLIKDKVFYRRLLDGDRAANRDWGLITSILSLRPVRR